METKSIERLQQLHPIIRDKAIDAYNEAVAATPAGVHPYIDQTYRSFEESERLYAQGRTTPGQIVSNARGGQSFHNYGLAADFHLQINGKDVWNVDNNWMVVVNIFKKYGFTWGGDFTGSFKDFPHLEYRNGYKLAQLQAKYKAKDFIAGNTYLNLA
ncbi:M15 family metallopeptidase [Mucilaginibacter sp. 10I4]|uniref:M15 family metallopeptidase n=1 Tax=Mucilaginibacter sp. 10I4 TaxID=3048580 RepID=UPI002B23471D|nr:M15 family metallopeptidase [Mucilaginibacter sp. 10I4]MEB0262289.1 M15 family metallopeptidase [Mucilaginibacter sp. 10I4]